MKKIIECVPNFSEGRNPEIIREITKQIESVAGVMLLDVDPGETTNRTVVTFAGTPDEVSEAAFRAVKKATELIDMSCHKGAHPRFGATDVCPFIPVANITMEEVVILSRKFAERVGNELGIPVYCYEHAAFSEERKNLAHCRSGEYEGLETKLKQEAWRPDFGPANFLPRTGAIAVGARDFLVAVNFNLNTTSVRRANAVAFDVREKGRPLRDGNPVTGKIVTDATGNQVMVPGTLPATKAIGWFIEEYGIAQVSMNITDISITPLHIAFDEVVKKAGERGLRVTGAELVGLIPKRVLIEAGKYYLKKQMRSVGVSENETIKIAVKSMGLDDLKPFHPEEKVIEFLLQEKSKTSLIKMTCEAFAEETASESPAPGGGSVAAFIGALGVALGAMVANLSSHKRGWDEKWEYFSDWAEKGQYLKNMLMSLVDEDTNAFNQIMKAFELPKKSEKEKQERKHAIQDATRYAAEVPMQTMKISMECMELLVEMAENGMASSLSDIGVGMLSIHSAAKGAYLNVLINAAQLEDKEISMPMINEAQALLKKFEEQFDVQLEKIEARILK